MCCLQNRFFENHLSLTEKKRLSVFKTIAGGLQGGQRQDPARGVEAQEEVAGLPAGPHQGLFYTFAYFHYFFKSFFTKVFLKDDQELFLEQERDRILAKKILVLQVLLLKQYRTASLRYSGSDSWLVL